ncbi:hypothetical protein Cme02nite_71250 [Catellatospora methionotrophica]|uniref:Uncharacterized protein n=1 Tax=Catellatospora methionotrophica TaxID=121620 RepID=A0A8J3LI72_9ACTN|nr:hypothetical protein [Catellatospora methionotrophica]GIG18793.1 hypothetical protein Cme02nite_71250 [Catellatospora methionotrophica]
MSEGCVRVDRSAAFAVNGVGSREGTLPFPLSFSVSSAGGVFDVVAAAASASELVDLLAAYARGQAVVLNVGTNSWLNDDYGQLPLGRIAGEQGVAAQVHDIRWAATRYWSDDLLVMPWAELPRFLDGWYPYDIEILDVAGTLTAAEVAELALAVNTRAPDAPLLPTVAGANLWFGGHDDCYLNLETASADLVSLLLARLLALRAGTALLIDGDLAAEDVVVPQPPVALAAALLAVSSAWVGRVAQVRAGAVELALAPVDVRWRTGNQLPGDMPYTLTLDLPSGRWSQHVTGAIR